MERDFEQVSTATQFLRALPHARVLNIHVVSASRGCIVLKLPFQPQFVANPATGVIHGGVLSTLLDTACGTAVVCSFDHFEPCPTLDLRIDHMGMVPPNKPVLAYAEVYRVTHSVVFTKGFAYIDDPENPVAHCVATFMRVESTKDNNPRIKSEIPTLSERLE